MFGRLKHHPQTPSSKEDGASKACNPLHLLVYARHNLLPILFRGGGRGVVAAGAVLALTSAAPPAALAPTISPDIAAACGTRDGWSDPAPPQHIHGDSWYVGTCGITVVLVRTSAGLVLFDSGPADAAPLVLANIRSLGFDPKQVKWLFSTHEHFDHAGGFAALQAATGARLAVGPYAATALRTGTPYADDPQFAGLQAHPMQPARVDRVLKHNQSLTVGGTRFTAYATPTHSPGSTSWTWQSCEQARCLTIALVDSVNTISADAYRFSAHPDRVTAALIGLARIDRMPCGVLLTPHPSASNLHERLAGRAPLADPAACRAYAQAGRERLGKRLASEQAAK